eukprot:g9470.t1
MPLIFGKRFDWKQDDMLSNAPPDGEVAMYAKFEMNKFMWFESPDEFWDWYFRAEEGCKRQQRAFSAYEILRTGRDMCFIADLEVYCPPETHWTQLQKIEYTIKNLFRAAYGKYADTDNLVITRNSRMSKHKKEKGGEKVPMYKISLHFLGKSEIFNEFNEMHTSCEMKDLAKLVNTSLVADIQPLATKHDILLPGGNVLDLGIYTKNRLMSLIGTAKTLGGGAFERAEESRHVPIKECIVTQQFAGEVSYFQLPDGLKGAAGHDTTKKKSKRNVPTKHLVHKPCTREKAETGELLRDYLQIEFRDSVTVTYNGLYGGQDSYAFLWGEICETAVFLINRAPHRAIDGSSPFTKLFGKEPDLSGLRAIGARAFVHKERYGNKLEEKAWEGVMLGYGKDSKSYRIYNPHNRRITESRSVTFIETPHRSLKNADQDELYSNNGEEDEKDEDYRQDVLAHLPLLDAETDSTVKKKDEDKHEPRPPYYEGSPSPAPSIESGGEVESPASPNSGGSPHDDFSQPDDNDSGGQEESYEQDDSGQASSDVGAPLDPVQEEDEEGDTSAGQQDQQGSSPAQQASPPVDLSRQPVTSLNRTLRSMGPTHDTPSIENIDTAGLDGKSKSMLRRVQIDMKGYDEPEQKDQAHLVYAPSFVEYAYVTETSAQSNPDPASISLPNTFKEAKASSHSAQWTAAMNKELASLKENNVYDLIVPAGCKVIGSRWVFKVKSNYTFKARLVRQGYAQRPGIDCGATFAPVCRIESQRILMAIACHYDWDIIMLDVKTAFLQSPIDAPTYVRQPPGYEKMDAQGKPLVMKLKQAVYGLRTASRVWHLTLDKALQDLGFRATKTDPCMYTLQIGGEYCILTIYVDDILVTAPDKNFLARIKKKLMERFTMSDLGEVSLILGMKITRDRVKKTLSINQTDYILSILERFGMQDCNPVSTPCQGGEIPLEQPAETLLDEDGIKTYQSPTLPI